MTYYDTPVIFEAAVRRARSRVRIDSSILRLATGRYVIRLTLACDESVPAAKPRECYTGQALRLPKTEIGPEIVGILQGPNWFDPVPFVFECGKVSLLLNFARNVLSRAILPENWPAQEKPTVKLRVSHYTTDSP
jgi:hypothetical protein